MKGSINPGHIRDASESPLRAFNGAPKCPSVGSTDIIYHYDMVYTDHVLGIQGGTTTGDPFPSFGLPFGRWLLTLTLDVIQPIEFSCRIGMAENIKPFGISFFDDDGRFMVNSGSWHKVHLKPGASFVPGLAQINSNWSLENGPDLFNIATLSTGETGKRIIKQILPEQNEVCVYQFFPYLFTDFFEFPAGFNHWASSINAAGHPAGWSIQGFPSGLYPNGTIIGTLQFRFTRIAVSPLFTWTLSPPRTVNFNNRSFFNPALHPTWDWNFGDGSAHVTTVNASHGYPASGRYIATLSTTDDTGETKTFQQVIVLPLKANFTVSVQPSLSQFVSINITQLSIGASTWDWDFGDGSAHSTLERPNHVYPKGHTYIITLTIGDGAGKFDSKSVTVVT